MIGLFRLLEYLKEERMSCDERNVEEQTEQEMNSPSFVLALLFVTVTKESSRGTA